MTTLNAKHPQLERGAVTGKGFLERVSVVEKIERTEIWFAIHWPNPRAEDICDCSVFEGRICREVWIAFSKTMWAIRDAP